MKELNVDLMYFHKQKQSVLNENWIILVSQRKQVYLEFAIIETDRLFD